MLLALPLGSLAFGGDVPANDDCQGAVSLVVGTMEIDTAPANTGPPWNDFQNCENFGVFQMHRDLWYRWTAPSGDTLRLDLCDAADFDSRIAVYEGTCGGLELVACNDDGLSCHNNTSQLDLPVTAGTPYYVRIGGFSETSAGLATLTVTFPWHDCLEPLLPCESDFDRNGSVDVDDILAVLGNWNADGPPRPHGDCDPLPFGDCRTDVNDLLSVLSSLGACSLACEMPWSCGQNPADFRCSAIDDDCICMEAIVGGTACINSVTDPACQDMQSCQGGDCPPGYVCVTTCCNEPKCMPLCETPIPGGCCLGFDCTMDFETTCLAAGGDWLGPYTTCEGNPCTDPACADGFECGDDHTLFSCDQQNDECLCFATFDGGAACLTLEYGHDCEAVYAPCLDGNCPEGYVCAQGCCGIPLCFPECGTQAPLGACCMDGACVQMEREPCLLLDGQWLGWGISCGPDTCPPPCPAGEIEDCNGNCAPIDWIGDNHCDDGSSSWNGIPIHFDCDLFDCDGGVCTCIP
ncbi:MAG: hypothetical protein QGG74_05580 [Phycisphaerales bacterium]|nr:hypothetical protein [Phycisphaerales bacterium]